VHELLCSRSSYIRVSVKTADSRSVCSISVTAHVSCHPTASSSCKLLSVSFKQLHLFAVLLEKLTVARLVKEFPSFYGTQRFITLCVCVCARARNRFSVFHFKLNTLLVFKPFYAGPCHLGMARPRVADGGDGLQIWRVAANILKSHHG